MEDCDKEQSDDLSFNMGVKNPFVHSIEMSLARRIQMWLFVVFVLPFRLLGMAIFFPLTLLVGELATRRMDFSNPMSGFRKHILLPIFIFCGRMLFFCGGFVWVRLKGKRASCEEAPILVLAPHSSFYDALVFLSLGMPSVVGKTETALSPIGSFIKITQPILVNRDDPSSRQDTLAEIRNRALSGGKWPQVLIFPEGTCTNRSCLINYKQGAFTVGCPVQPAVLRWGYGVDSITWTWDGPGVLELLWTTALQPYTTLEIEFLPVYVPSEAEKEDPKLYATNVRAVMAKAANLPTTDLSFDDCRRIRTAVQFGLPIASHINEYGKLSRYLLTRERISDDQILPSQVAYVTDRLLSMASATRDWHKGGCEALSVQSLTEMFFDDAARQIPPKAAALLQRVLKALPKTQNGQSDVRAVVVHLCFLMFSASPSIAVRLAFQAFEAVSTGVTEDIPMGDDEDGVADDKYATRSIATSDAALLLTFVYHLSLEEAKSLMPHNSAKNTGASVAVGPGFVYHAVNKHYPKLVSSYADYKSEMNRMRRLSERPFSETSSESNSVSSLCSLSADDATFKPGHRRNASNVSVGSTGSLDQSETELRMRVAQQPSAKDS
uniref:PlsC domain-containing protein n=2 Tax=Mesocestoides corti TaxID=53468 RepID=A0A5K3EIH8_MESCO